MRFRVLRVRNLACFTLLLTLAVVLYRSASPQLPYASIASLKFESEEPFFHATVKGSWFPNREQRNRWGFADTWRNPDGNKTAGAITGITGSFEDVVDPIAFETFYMLKTGANVMWERLPAHFDTSLKRFPFHQIYSDEAAVIGKETVLDILGELPQSLLDDPQLVGYRVREQNIQNNWGWDSHKIKLDSDHEGWESDKFKNIPMLLHAYRNAPKHCKWFVFADDDTYIMSQSLGSMLRNLDSSKPYYLGSPALIEVPFSNTGKVGESLKAALPEHKNVQLWFAHGGSGIVLSRGTLDALFWDPQRDSDTVAKYSRLAIHQCCGDAMVAYILREELKLFLNEGVDEAEFYNDPFQGSDLANTQILLPSGGWCQRILSWHHLWAWEISKLFDWEASLLERKPNLQRGVLYSDVYHDFILPFIMEERENWHISAGSDLHGPDDSYELSSADELNAEDDIIWPGRSKEHCKLMCKDISMCLGWSYSTNRCELQKLAVTRGEALNVHSRDWDNERGALVSGWMVDRIRSSRAGEGCDALEYDKSTGTYNDSPDTSEGWYFRRLELELQAEKLSPAAAFERIVARSRV